MPSALETSVRAALDNPRHFVDNFFERAAALFATPQRNDAKGAAHVAAILDGHMHRHGRMRPVRNRQRWLIDLIE